MRTAYITLSDCGQLGVMQWPEPGLKAQLQLTGAPRAIAAADFLRMLSGMCRMPSRRLLGIQSIGPSGVKVSIRARSSAKASRISMRARLAPRHTWAPKPKATWRLGERAMSKRKGSSNTACIAIGRHLPVGDLVAGLDAVALVVHVARCRAALVDRGRGPAQDLVDGGAHLGDVGRAQPLELLGMIHQRSQAATDGAARRLGASGKQQHEEIEQLIIRERPALAAILLRARAAP